ncbi:MAG: arginine--tRNA ligase [Paludibacteraceae bacterium]|nr:arginine--tRNA ligase [Paludibacteraceae bacterium]
MQTKIVNNIISAVKSLYGAEIDASVIQIQKTKKEFEGHLTAVLFPIVKIARKAPAQVCAEIGEYLTKEMPEIARYNAVGGYLNLVIGNRYWLSTLDEITANPNFGIKQPTDNSPLMMVEYSSPNTNKPLHLGHVRNNLLGWSIAQIQEANGWRVVKTNIVNDRGIHICKSMLAWQKWGNGATPESTGKKGDHLIGDYYVLFDKHYREQIKDLMTQGMDEETAKKEAPLIKEAQEMLLKWEQGDKDIRKLWETMNSWVYQGFDETYKQMGVSFDKIYYESQTYKEGKKEVERGLQEGLFYRREDGSVWADLTKDGLDEKLLLRKDGTSVYMTQDIGTAKLRFEDYPIDRMVYVVGNEQEYHFKVLSILLDRLGFRFGKDLVHFSYGMVELPNGKMKSREGTVVDADDLMAEMISEARNLSEDKALRIEGMSEKEQNEIARVVGLGALKYFILKVDPRKNMLFNPEESIDFNGNTGPFIQYCYARIKSVLRKAGPTSNSKSGPTSNSESGLQREVALIQQLLAFEDAVQQAGQDFSPAVIANYAYELAKQYNQFYHDCSILGEQDSNIRNLRLELSAAVAQVIKTALRLLGIETVERM